MAAGSCIQLSSRAGDTREDTILEREHLKKKLELLKALYMPFHRFPSCNLIDKWWKWDLGGWCEYGGCIWMCLCLRGLSRQPDSVTDTENRLCSGDCVSHILTHFQSVVSLRWSAARDFWYGMRRVGHLSASEYIYVWSVCTYVGGGTHSSAWWLSCREHTMKDWLDNCLFLLSFGLTIIFVIIHTSMRVYLL